MYIVYCIFTAFFLLPALIFYFSRKKIKFFTTGCDAGFKLDELLLLWNLAVKCMITDPCTLFWSEETMSKCIARIIEEIKQSENQEQEKLQKFLSKLYEFKTKTKISYSLKKGLSSTVSLSNGQKIIILFKDHGIFKSKILNNARELTVKMPVNQDKAKSKNIIWENAKISVYLWRKNDANYIFDTTVLGSGVFRGEPVLYLHHTDKLDRLQKRKTIRANCHIPATLFLMIKTQDGKLNNYSEKGYNCFLEDISESGCLIRIGGKGVSNIRVKLYFMIGSEQIIMQGLVKSAEYNENLNQSRLHLECKTLDPKIKNIILTFVYNILPNEEKILYDALKQSEEDSQESSDSEDSEKNEEEV